MHGLSDRALRGFGVPDHSSSEITRRGSGAVLARQRHSGKSLFVRWCQVSRRLNRDLNRLGADRDINLDLGIAEVHLVAAPVATADDRQAHCGISSAAILRDPMEARWRLGGRVPAVTQIEH